MAAGSGAQSQSEAPPLSRPPAGVSPMYNPNLSAEQLEIRDTVRDFAAREIKPVALDPDRLERADRRLPPEILALASQMGLRTLALPESLGGAGAEQLTSCIVAEELAAGDVGAATTLAHTSMLGRLLFGQWMTEEQRARFLPAFLADDHFHLALARCAPGDDPGWNYREPAVSTPEVNAKATRLANGDWVVNGTYPFVVNAPIARLFAVEVLASTALGIEQFETLLVTPDMRGVALSEAADADIGHEGEALYRWHHGRAGALVFDDCRVPGANLVGGGANSPSAADAADAIQGPLTQALNLGVGRAAYEAALEYAKLRVQGGRPIIEHESIGTILAEIAIRVEVARNAVWKAAWAADNRAACAAEGGAVFLTTIARVFTSEAVHAATLAAAEVFGAMGVMRDVPMQKYVRDALVFLHADGGNVPAKLRIAELAGDYRRAAAATRKAAA